MSLGKPPRSVILAWAAVVIALPASASPSGDPVAGAVIYQRCMACHALTYHRTGPRHCGLIGRRAGSAAGYPYSKAMRDSGIVWNRQTLDAFLASPTTYVVGTLMGYAGVADARERRDLIAYLASVSADNNLCGVKQGANNDR